MTRRARAPAVPPRAGDRRRRLHRLASRAAARGRGRGRDGGGRPERALRSTRARTRDLAPVPPARSGAPIADCRRAVHRIFHLAGAAYVPPSLDDPAGDLGNNAEVTLDVLEAVRRGSPATPVVYTSSAAVYGSPTVLPIAEETPIVPVSPYGVSKYAAEQYVSLYARLHGLRTASLRLFSVFGPGQRKQVVFDLLAKLAADPDRLEVIGAGTEMRDFIFVDDVVTAATCVMARAPLQGEVYNVASGQGVTIRDLVGHIVAVVGLSPTVRYTGEVRPGDALHWVGDIARLRGARLRAGGVRRGWGPPHRRMVRRDRRAGIRVSAGYKERLYATYLADHLTPRKGGASLETLHGTGDPVGQDAPSLSSGGALRRHRRPRMRLRQRGVVAAAARICQRRRRGREPGPDRAGRPAGHSEPAARATCWISCASRPPGTIC